MSEHYRNFTTQLQLAGMTVYALCLKAVEDGIITPEQAVFIQSEYIPVFMPKPWYKRWSEKLGFSDTDGDDVILVKFVHASNNAKIPHAEG